LESAAAPNFAKSRVEKPQSFIPRLISQFRSESFLFRSEPFFGRFDAKIRPLLFRGDS
jgi:hypothetical protein